MTDVIYRRKDMRPCAEHNNKCRCTGNWLNDEVPKEGYVCEGMDTYADLTTCDFCGKEKIRTIHMMRHPVTGHEFNVGCVCAAHMEMGEDSPPIHVLVSRTMDRDVHEKKAYAHRQVTTRSKEDALKSALDEFNESIRSYTQREERLKRQEEALAKREKALEQQVVDFESQLLGGEYPRPLPWRRPKSGEDRYYYKDYEGGYHNLEFNHGKGQYAVRFSDKRVADLPTERLDVAMAWASRLVREVLGLPT